MKKELSNNLYIPSIEASSIYNYLYRGGKIELEYIGMIPRSLELEKLLKVGLVPDNKKTAAKLDKLLSSDVINVKFSQKVKTGDDVLKSTKAILDGLVKKELDLENEVDEIKRKKKKLGLDEYRTNLNNFIELIELDLESGDTDRIDKWKSIKEDDLRKIFYKEGFTITNVDKKTGELTEVRYKVYKRSSAKSRIGQCLFIKETFHEEMIDWSRMGIPFDKQPEEIDINFPSLLAYESLVGSSIESTVYIHSKNILIVEDVESKFPLLCNVIRKGKPTISKRGKIKKGSDRLDSFRETAEIKNSLFDGSSLLQSDYFPEGKAMMLLRNHMFKSAAFNTEIQKYYIDQCPEDIDYNEWQIPNINGQLMYAKDVHLICTPSSLKALKFSNVLGSDIDMWEHWKNVVEDDNFLFGVCKNEKESKHGKNQQLSYQMVNSLILDPKNMKEEMDKLSEYEHGFIKSLKNKDGISFIEYAKKTANSINSNQMFVDLYERNNNIVRAEIFRNFKTREIYDHVEFVKRGKIRMNGDYLVMLGNGMEYLAHSIGKLDTNDPKPVLKGNEIYTTRFEFGKELTGFRNPHTSPSNILISINKDNKEIEKYFNLTPNIVMVNAIKFPIQDILSSADYDSDTCLFIENELLLAIGKKASEKYKVCVNDVPNRPIPYKVCNESMAIIDNELAKSQYLIGEVVNLGQWTLSAYWDLLSKDKTEEELEGLLKKIDIISILSCICIDLAKKFYHIKIKSEIANVRRVKELKVLKKVKKTLKTGEIVDVEKLVGKKKPLFWKVVVKDEKKKKELETMKYECPMDYLYESLIGLKRADKIKSLELKELIVKETYRSADRKQQPKIIEYITTMCSEINNIKTRNLEEDEEYTAIDNLMKYCEHYLSKLTVDKDTMYSLLLRIADNKAEDIVRKLLTMLHRTQKEVFLEGFKIKNVTT